MTASVLRALLAADRVTHVPGVHDPLTASLAVAAGHGVVHLSAAAVSATMLGRPDLGLVPTTQIADRASTLEPALHGVPLLADADTGYGSPRDAVWTGLAYSRAGIAGLILRDRVGAARPGLVDAGLAAATIEALAGEVPQLAVIARTGAYAVDGVAGTIERGRAYAHAGAAAVCPDGVPDLAGLTAVHRALPGVPLVVERSEAAPYRPDLSDADLAAAGVRLVLHPLTALLAAIRAASAAYRVLAESGDVAPIDRMPWAVVTALAAGTETTGSNGRQVPGNLQT
ncbi:isocitrate lyase/PEP mutase family protein [Actinoplanes teichomyceticus]|uniref:Methylisocitrate lyase n=1 Tax=Actinoplanes teichomyceticus TaxID=1867 RepID=A0A561WAH5_ACTTI|nr:isocitrate lyase/PEP mutase family protein [Actinoplanes teichomyceticus]TWG20864.1 methylisocitrate lyase [Actinoplanes teichomyceticus]GIF14525.1 carboxyvinyl-carboxyphosphonate phosphorylmutase [Actinoplanes teichomyceticus]